MARPTFHVTYDIITSESAEQGEAADMGFASPGGWHHDDPAELTLREAVDCVSRGCMENSGSWFTEVDARENYNTGDSEYRSLHPYRTITPSSYRRLARLLCGR